MIENEKDAPTLKIVVISSEFEKFDELEKWLRKDASSQELEHEEVETKASSVYPTITRLN